MSTLAASITIRPAYADDELALGRLAALDSAAAPPPAPRVLAEVDGELRAALSLHDGSVIADSFSATADLVALLRAHAAAGAAALLRGRRGRRSRRPAAAGAAARAPRRARRQRVVHRGG
ncbi:MAG TPA: hypothetical protein VG186_14165 [Solirubrobacteraceae bacterium]|nr:hypothetical protein [Solirubrobacteraceae bacterium]